MPIRRLTVEHVRFMSHELAREMLSWNEPIPEFGTRYPNVLESCLSTPFQRYAGRDLYPGLAGKAAILFYLMVKNHPFQNGNKRIALTTMLVFFYRNGKWLDVDEQEMYQHAKWVAASPATAKDEMVSFLGKYFRKNLTNR